MTVEVDQPLSAFVGGVDLDRFEEELLGSLVKPAYLGGVIRENVYHLHFDAAFDQADADIFDGLVANHSGLSLPEIKIFSFMETHSVDHKHLDYKTGLSRRLYQKIEDIFRGEVRRVAYYENYDAQATPTHTGLILDVMIAYSRQSNGVVIDRVTTRTWYRGDGTPSPDQKITHKVYDNLKAMKEGRLRRTNVVDKLELDVLGMLLMTGHTEEDGITFVSKYGDQLTSYQRTGDLSFKSPPADPNLSDDTAPWLDQDLAALGMPGVTIRMIILDSLKDINAP